jgi:hypothetical protein
MRSTSKPKPGYLWAAEGEGQRPDGQSTRTKAMVKSMNSKSEKLYFHSHLYSKVISGLATRHKNSFQPR